MNPAGCLGRGANERESFAEELLGWLLKGQRSERLSKLALARDSESALAHLHLLVLHVEAHLLQILGQFELKNNLVSCAFWSWRERVHLLPGEGMAVVRERQVE